MKVNNKLIVARAEKNGMNQRELAEMVGVTKQYMSLVETGAVEPSLTLKMAICKALDKEMKDLF